MIEYILKSAITLAMLYSLFFACLSRETFHRFNRVCLLLIMLVSLVLPFVHLTVGHPTMVQEAVQMPADFLRQMPIVTVSSGESTVTEPLTWGRLLTYIYLAGVGAMLVMLLVQTFRMYRLTRGGLRHTDNRGNTVILKPSVRSPFSIFRWIVMSVDDYEQHRQSILTHEQEHIRLGHTYDLLLLEAMRVLQWFNPFIWLLGHDLCAIHEYEADEAVINQGIDAKQYQQLLVLKAVGNRLQPFANTLGRGSLKQRIIMMYQKKSNRWMMLKALFVIPTMGFTLYAFATPEAMPEIKNVLEKKASTHTRKTVVPTPVEKNNGTEEAPTVQDYVHAYHTAIQTEAADEKNVIVKAAAYSEGDAALAQYLAKNISYPQIAHQYQVSGRIFLRFMVEADGTVTDIEALKAMTKSNLEEGDGAEEGHSTISPETMVQVNKALVTEAIRGVSSTSGKWTPAEDEDGKKIRSEFALPVTFHLAN